VRDDRFFVIFLFIFLFDGLLGLGTLFVFALSQRRQRVIDGLEQRIRLYRILFFGIFLGRVVVFPGRRHLLVGHPENIFHAAIAGFFLVLEVLTFARILVSLDGLRRVISGQSRSQGIPFVLALFARRRPELLARFASIDHEVVRKLQLPRLVLRLLDLWRLLSSRVQSRGREKEAGKDQLTNKESDRTRETGNPPAQASLPHNPSRPAHAHCPPSDRQTPERARLRAAHFAAQL
jgi:hypothetical protein